MATDTKKLSAETFLKESEIRTMRKDIQQAKEATRHAKIREPIVKKEEILKPVFDIKKTPKQASPLVPPQRREAPTMESPMQSRPMVKPSPTPKSADPVKPFSMREAAPPPFKTPTVSSEPERKVEVTELPRKEIPIRHETPVKEAPVTIHIKEDFPKEAKEPPKRKFMEEVEILSKEEQ